MGNGEGDVSMIFVFKMAFEISRKGIEESSIDRFSMDAVRKRMEIENGCARYKRVNGKFFFIPHFFLEKFDVRFNSRMVSTT